LAVDSADSAMMAYLVNHTEPNSLVLVNIQDPNEYFVEMQMQLGQVDGRPDLRVLTFSRDITIPGDTTNVYIVAPFVVNQPLLTVRMGIIEDTQNMWSYSLQEFLHISPGWQVIFESSQAIRLSDVNFPRLFCRFVKTRAFCATPAPMIDTRPFTYGWHVYKLETP
jgi:hypothetical protein